MIRLSLAQARELAESILLHNGCNPAHARAVIEPTISGYHWFSLPKTDARLRLVDPQYGFITPLARFFTIGFTDDLVDGIRMSPQIEPLLLDDTLKVVLDLQEQLRKGGWIPVRVKNNPQFADTPEWRAQLRDVNRGGWTYWQAGEKYKLMMGVNRFKDDRNPTEERHLIKMELTQQRKSGIGRSPDQGFVQLTACRRYEHYVTGIPFGVAQAIELTLASQCRPLSDGRTVEFSNNPTANLADIDQRMTFVLKAAAQFDELLHSTERHRIEQAIDDIAKGQGVQ